MAVSRLRLESDAGVELIIQGRFFRNITEIEVRGLTEEGLLEALLTKAEHISSSLRKLKVFNMTCMSEHVLELLESRKSSLAEREVQTA